MWARIKHWLEVRIGMDEVVQIHLKDHLLPKHADIFNILGFLALIGFLIQAGTGVLLLTHYVPHPDHAFQSVQFIMYKMPFGWLIRSMHVVGSNMLVAVLFLHFFVVFARASYKSPRELTWVSGWLMFILIFFFLITGALLPWNQFGYWSMTVVTAIFTFVPFIGDYISTFLRGGEYVTGITLNRFFAFHVAILPFVLVTFMVVHIFLIWRIGFAPSQGKTTGQERKNLNHFRPEVHEEGLPLYRFISRDMFTIMIYFAVLFLIVAYLPNLFLPETTIVKADPFMTPEKIEPEWYFNFSFQIFKFIPFKNLGIGLQIAMLAIFVLWPFLDTSEERRIYKRPLLFGTFLFITTIWILLTLWGKA
jgi:ubiquinol-cytochrome c reductase cytochrome b subunit